MDSVSIRADSPSGNVSWGQRSRESTSLPPITESGGQVTRWLQTFVAPGQVVELRALDVERLGLDIPVQMGGYYDFNHLQDLATHALELTEQARGVCVTLNPVNPDLLARSYNRIRVLGRGEGAGQNDVIARRWLLVDLDPQRPSGISSTDAEKHLAHDRACLVRDHLRRQGWSDGIFADSGNGFHLLYRINLPTDSPLVRSVLRGLDQRFSDGQVKIDTTVHDPARIVRLYGTITRKGDSTPDRPHRISRVLEMPAELRPVDPLLLVRLAADTPVEGPAPQAVRGQSEPQLSEVHKRARSYLATVPLAISGRRGHNQTYKAACALIHGFNLTVDEALPLLREYNSRCQPPWSESELRHKLESALESPDAMKPRGYLLNSKAQSPVTESRPNTELPAIAGGWHFWEEVPDFVLSPVTFFLDNLTDRQIWPSKGRPNVHLSHRLVRAMKLLTLCRQKVSPYVMPDEVLAQFLHGAKPPKRWKITLMAGSASVCTCEKLLRRDRKELKSLEDNPNALHDTAGGRDRIDELRRMIGRLERLLLVGTTRNRGCPDGCLFLDSHIHHQHYCLEPFDAATRANFGTLFEEVDHETVHYDPDRRNENNQLVRQQLISANRLHWAYLPIELFGRAAGLRQREIRLIQGLMRERTRNNPRRTYQPGDDRLAYVKNGVVLSVGGRGRIQCPLLDPDRRYIVFGGNHRKQRGCGYPVIGRQCSGWLRKSGYPVTPESPRERLWEYVSGFLEDLHSLSEPFQLVGAFLGRNREWRSVAEALQMIRKAEGRRWLEKAQLRIYAPDNHLTIWRRWLAEKLGFFHIPGGEWTLPPERSSHPTMETYGSPRLHTPEGVQAWLKEHGLTQAALAKRIGCTRHWVGNQLTGRTGWSADFQAAIEKWDRELSESSGNPSTLTYERRNKSA